MKKRLLSAALALVMVLTLLPMNVFAATAASYGGLKTPDPAANVTVQRATSGNVLGSHIKYGEWYWVDRTTNTYYTVNTGIVAGVGGSGRWYQDVSAYTTTNNMITGSFTVIGGGADVSTYANTSLTIDIGSSSAGTITVGPNLTQLTITGKGLNSTEMGSVSGISSSRVAYTTGGVNTGLTIRAEDVDVGVVNLAGRANTVTLTNAKATSITMNGQTQASATATTWTYSAQNVTAKSSEIGGITITNGNGGQVTLEDTKCTGAISVTSDGGSITVKGASSVSGAITSDARTATGAYPSVTVSGNDLGVSPTGIGAISQGSTSNKDISVTVSGTTTKVAGISVTKGTVKITSADVQNNVEVKEGTLNIDGTGVNVGGVLTLGATTTTNLSITAGDSTFGGITAVNGRNLNITGWNDLRTNEKRQNGTNTVSGNNYGVLTLGNYSGGKVTGGTFSLANDSNFGTASNVQGWLDMTNLLFFTKDSINNKIDLYKRNELSRAISDLGTDVARQNDKIIALGQGGSGKQYIVLMNGNVVWAKIAFTTSTRMILPTEINNVTISEWTAPNTTIIPAGTEHPLTFIPGADLQLNANSIGTSVEVKRITKATASIYTDPVGNDGVENQNVNVTMTGNNIALSGAIIPDVGGLATILVDLETDAIDINGNPVVLKNVCVHYTPTTRKVEFSSIQPTDVTLAGVSVVNGELVLNRGTGAHYTVSANLSVSASDLKLYYASTEIQATVSGSLSNLTGAQKQQLINMLTPAGSASFSINNNPAMLVAINAAQATITANNSVASWVSNAKNTIWRSGVKDAAGDYKKLSDNSAVLVPHTGNLDTTHPDGNEIVRHYDTAYLVPYLVVNVTAYDPSGTLSATLTPYYRIDVSAGTGYVAADAYTVQAGRPLALNSTTSVTGNDSMNPVQVTFKLPSNFDGVKYMHQDGKYVYTSNGTQTWSIAHVGSNGTLGTININSVPGSIRMSSSIASRTPALVGWMAYDSLQAAIDDTVPGGTVRNSQTAYGYDYELNVDTIVYWPGTGQGETADTIIIDGTYTGSCDISMTGRARTVIVKAQGQQKVTCNSRNVNVQTTGGFIYVLQLKSDDIVNETVNNSNITVNNAAGGTVTVSPANTIVKAGEVVTITLNPAVGYTANGVTVRTNAGTNVSVTGSGNRYTFIMPIGATSVFVTPSFRRNQTVGTGATVTVSNVANGSATTSAGTERVAGGSVVSVNVTPSAGYRTMGLYVTADGGAATANRTGVNSFTFTVPVNATNVVVTPRFDRSNGTVFEDVWSTEYFSDAVGWAVSRGVTNGKSTYTFGSYDVCTRADMVTFLYRAAGSPTVSNVNNPFWDVQAGTYYYDAVMWAVSKGITNGVERNRFGVNEYVTRGQAVTFLYRYEGSAAVSANSQFRDVSANDYYAKAVSWASGKGVTNGTSATAFSPNSSCKRCEIVTFLYRDVMGVRA